MTGIQRRHPGTNCYHQEEAFGNTGKFEKEQFSFSDTNKNVVLHVTATSLQQPPRYNSHLATTATSLQQPVSSVSKVAIVDRSHSISFQ